MDRRHWAPRFLLATLAAGPKAILCAPSAAPPVWMGGTYPEIGLVGAEGWQRRHGTSVNGGGLLLGQTPLQPTQALVWRKPGSLIGASK